MGVSEFENKVVQMLKNNVDKWYTGYKGVYLDFRQQAVCRYENGGHGVVDLAVNAFMPGKPYAGNWYNFEIKSSKSDLNSGRGLNLYTMYNYIVYPHILITTLPGIITLDAVERKLKEINCEHAGIIAVISDNDFEVIRRAKRYHGNGMPKTIKAYEYKTGRI